MSEYVHRNARLYVGPQPGDNLACGTFIGPLTEDELNYLRARVHISARPAIKSSSVSTPWLEHEIRSGTFHGMGGTLRHKLGPPEVPRKPVTKQIGTTTWTVEPDGHVRCTGGLVDWRFAPDEFDALIEFYEESQP